MDRVSVGYTTARIVADADDYLQVHDDQFPGLCSHGKQYKRFVFSTLRGVSVFPVSLINEAR